MGGFFLFTVLLIITFMIMFWLIRRYALTTPVPPAAQDLFTQLSSGKHVIAAFPPGALDYGIAGWPNTHPYMTQPCILIVGKSLLEIYNLNGTRVAAYEPADIVWYGPAAGGGDMRGMPARGTAVGGMTGVPLLHVYTRGRWFQVLFAPLRENPQRVLDAFAEFKPVPQRAIAYSPFAPAAARVAADGQHVGVARGEKVRLWFSPVEFVVMRGIGEIAKLPATTITAITAALSPEGTGSVQIGHSGGTLSYYLDDFIPFAIALGEVLGITPTLPAGYSVSAPSGAPHQDGLPSGYLSAPDERRED